MPDANTNTTGWGLIAGNGRFPFLVLEGARSQGIDMAVIALKEEASQELEKIAKRLHWVSLGELSKTIDLMHQEGVKQAVMAGQVKHNKIFSAIRPDWKLAKLLFSLPRKNTDALIGAVARVLEEEGIRLVDSTRFLKPLVPEAGVLTRRAPNEHEADDIAYGLDVARQIARDRKSTRLNSSHLVISYAVFCLKKKKQRPHSRPRYLEQAHRPQQLGEHAHQRQRAHIPIWRLARHRPGQRRALHDRERLSLATD